MNKRIIYKNEAGGVSIIIPTPNSDLTIEQIAAKDVPTGTPYEIVDATNVPTDRTFRNAWEVNTNAGGVTVRMPRAKDIWRDKIREARVEPLEALDTAFIRAIELGADTTQIAADKQALRDATADPAIDAATYPEELMQVHPAGLYIT